MEYRGIKCRSELQTYKHNLPENLGLQISGISRQQALSWSKNKLHDIAYRTVLRRERNLSLHDVWNFVISCYGKIDS